MKTADDKAKEVCARLNLPEDGVACLIIRSALMEQMDSQAEKRGEALVRIKQWAEAYPVEVFPEMTPADWKKADEVLTAAGLNLARISASNMRHVITKTTKIVDEGLAA